MTTYAEAFRERQREKQAANPFLDLTKQILVPATAFTDIEDELAVRQLLLETGTTTTPFWGNSPGDYDSMVMSKNFVVPGIVTVTGVGFEQRLHRDRPPGRHGTSMKQLGIQAAKFEIHIQMWTEEHLQQFERLVPLLKSQRYTVEEVTETVGFTGNNAGAGFTGSAGTTKKKYLPAGPQPFDMYHPLLALFKIRSAHILKVSMPCAGGRGSDIFEVKIDCEEHVFRTATAVKKADKSLEIVPSNPLIGETAETLAAKSKKPSAFVSNPSQPGFNTGGASGGW